MYNVGRGTQKRISRLISSPKRFLFRVVYLDIFRFLDELSGLSFKEIKHNRF